MARTPRSAWPKKLTVAVAGAAAAAVTVLCLLAMRGWISEKFHLYRLEHAGRDEGDARWRLIQALLDRRCAAVTPHLLRFYEDVRPFDGPEGLFPLVASLGTDAIPYLAKALDDGPVNDWRCLALEALGQFGSRAAVAVPAITRFLEGRDCGGACLVAAIKVLGLIGEEAAPAVPAVLRFGDCSNDWVRSTLYASLMEIGPKARDAVPLLLDALEAEHGEVLFKAAEALGRISPGHPRVLAGMIACLDDDNMYARLDAAEWLGKSGARAEEAVPALLQLLGKESYPGPIFAAAEALEQLAPTRGVTEALFLAREGSETARLAGLTALGCFRSHAKRVLPVLRDAARAQDEDAAFRAVNSIRRLGSEAEPAIADLVEICRRSQSPRLVQAAAEALGGIGSASPLVLSTLVGLLPVVGEHGGSRDGVADAFAALASRSDEVIVRLSEALTKDEATRRGAIRALYTVGPAAARAAPALEAVGMAAVREGDRETRFSVESALERILGRRVTLGARDP